MKKFIFSILTILILSQAIFSQKELWAINSGQDFQTQPKTYYGGSIIKYDINGENAQIMHNFEGTGGYFPRGPLFLASNGKLYGTTYQGGINETQIPNTSYFDAYGVVYEYDLILNKYRVVFNFYDSNLFCRTPSAGFIEPIPGKLFSTTRCNSFVYDINTETTSISSSYIPYINDVELMKAFDGNLYGTAYEYSQTCPGTTNSPPFNGQVIKINPITNAISIVYSFDCDWAYGTNPTGSLIEVSPGKLIGTAKGGGFVSGQYPYRWGVIFEYDIFTNTYTKKHDFVRDIDGGNPSTLIKGLNGKLYGVCLNGGNNPTPLFPPDTPVNRVGTIFEYDPVANTVTNLHNFGSNDYGTNPPVYTNSNQYPRNIMQASTGMFFGTFNDQNQSIFKFNPSTNFCNIVDLWAPNFSINWLNPNNFIEICRKPSYHEITTNVFTPCLGDNFSYDIQNTNATSYVWKKNGTIVPLQTTAVLNIASIATADNGTYTCTMTNECGTTVTMPLQINASCLSVDEVTAKSNNLKIYPSPTKNFLNIKLTDNKNSEIQKITIINLLGQTVITETKNFNKIDVSKIAQGVYDITVFTDNGNFSEKFVKE